MAAAKRNQDQFLDDDQFLSEFSKPQETAHGSQGGSKLDATATSAITKSKKGQKVAPKEMTDEDRRLKFEELLNADLIDVPEDYYDEPILFEKGSQLMQILASLEEKNLEIIKKSQDTEYSLEIKKQQEMRTQRLIGGNITSLNQTAKDLEQQILQARLDLDELKKQNKQMAGGEEQKKKKPAKDAQKTEEDEPDIDFLMSDLRVDIEKIYRYLVLADNEREASLDGKPPIEILQEIELRLNDHMRLIKYVHDDPDDGPEFHHKVKGLVENRRAAKQAEARGKINDELRKKAEIAQKRLEAKETLRVKKFGKPATSRSAKPKIKQKIVKKELDEETRDQLEYLGLELKDVPDSAEEAH